uniref:beta-sandwich lipoprotein n=1 Tax=Ruminococcus bromii TaxID=40518 RepID=UPI00402788BB
MRKRILAIVLMVVMIATTVLVTVGCTEATQVSYNVSQEADNFNVIRRLTVINTRTDKPSFELVAAFSLQVDNDDNQIEVVCETGKGEYKKHIIGLNDETMYVVEDISGSEVDKYRYEINFLPKQILPITFKSKD